MTQKIININPAKVEITVYPRRRRPEDKDVEHLRGLGGTWHTRVVTANKGKVLVDGAHRIVAAIADGINSIEAIDLGTLTDDEILAEAVARNSTHGKQLTLAEKQDMAIALVGSHTPSELTTLLGVASRSMSRWLSDAKDIRKASIVSKAVRLLARGKSMTAVAKELGVARGTLQGWIKQDEEIDDIEEKQDPTSAGPESRPSSSTQAETSDSGKSAATTAKVSGAVEPANDEFPVTYEELSDETKDAIAMMATGIAGEAKAILRETDNPDGLHWTDLVKFVIKEVRGNFPKSAQ
jgi:transposase-like protein